MNPELLARLRALIEGFARLGRANPPRRNWRRWFWVALAVIELAGSVGFYYVGGLKGLLGWLVTTAAVFGLRYLIINYRARIRTWWNGVRSAGRIGILAVKVIVAIVLWDLTILVCATFAPITVTIAVTLTVGFFAFLFVLPYIPNSVKGLSNVPNRYRERYTRGMDQQTVTHLHYPKSTFGFFTAVHQGQVKVVQKSGGQFVSCIMAYDGHMFVGERDDNDLTPRHAGYWEVTTTTDGYKDSHPIPFPPIKKPWYWVLYSPWSLLWWVLKRHIYHVTGYVFTGVPGFRGPRVYPMERFIRVTKADGSVELQRHEDYSDHYRVAHFQYPLKIADAPTQDKIPVKVLLNEIGRVLNPYMVAYNTDDDWPTRFTGSISNRVTAFARPRPLNEVWVAKNPAAAEELAGFITQVGAYPCPVGVPPQGSTCAFGIVIENSQVLDISPMDKEVEKRLGDVAIATVDRDAQILRAEGEAALVEKVGEKLRQYPEAAVVVQTTAMVQAAQAASASGNVILLGGGQSQTDPAMLALLQQLRRSGRRGANP